MHSTDDPLSVPLACWRRFEGPKDKYPFSAKALYDRHDATELHEELLAEADRLQCSALVLLNHLQFAQDKESLQAFSELAAEKDYKFRVPLVLGG